MEHNRGCELDLQAGAQGCHELYICARGGQLVIVRSVPSLLPSSDNELTGLTPGRATLHAGISGRYPTPVSSASVA